MLGNCDRLVRDVLGWLSRSSSSPAAQTWNSVASSSSPVCSGSSGFSGTADAAAFPPSASGAASPSAASPVVFSPPAGAQSRASTPLRRPT